MRVRSSKLAMLVFAFVMPSCDQQDRVDMRSDGQSLNDQGSETETASSSALLRSGGMVEDEKVDQPNVRARLAELSKDPNWHRGWNKLVLNAGAEYASFPYANAPDSIKATVMKQKKSVKLTDYWLRPTGYTTMWDHALKKYTNDKYRTDGHRWDTPTTWVPKMIGGKDSGGNMTLVTQFGTEIPKFWAGAKPLSYQTDWIFQVNYQTGAIMEIYDRQHYRKSAEGTIVPFFSELVARGYNEAMRWSPPGLYPIGGSYSFQGPTHFIGNDGQPYPGYANVRVVNRYESFTVPPARNKGKNCPAAEFKDVIAVRHEQWWYDKKTGTSRGDYLLIYMAKGIGWIYQLMSDPLTFNSSNQLTSGNQYFGHMSPVGFIKQSGDWNRLCPHEFRDMLKKK